jgi:peptidoglycan/LPS O-acetylase OafA/YrhL
MPTLTSLRWVAALAVFGRHNYQLVIGSSVGAVWNKISQPAPVAVSFFFLLSGFVLAWRYGASATVKDFWWRRISRIVPTYWLVALLAVPLLGVLGAVHSIWSVGGDLFVGTFLESWVPFSHVYYAGDGVAWSLSDEMFFYVLFPLAAALIVRMPPRRRLVLTAGLVMWVVAVPLALHPEAVAGTFGFWFVYINPLQRLPEFLIGVALGVFFAEGYRLPVTQLQAAALVVAGYFGDIWAPPYARWAVVTLVPLSLLVYASAQGDADGTSWRLLRHHRLVVLGEMSFSFYLVHQLVERSVARLVDYRQLPLGWALTAVAVSFLTSLGIAWSLYRLVERPTEKRLRAMRRMSRRPTFPAPSSASLPDGAADIVLTERSEQLQPGAALVAP